ncbi:unannotated protein [freshwater metagenome]|uniref:Unannotated protein n=1 Tax=freshwater metagenome TaxID=449393 RepID=A0A6J7XSK3_9ZZZZ|nr:hypothetical protein [Actinomycetota bacterium]
MDLSYVLKKFRIRIDSKNDKGSISLLIIGLFIVTISSLVVITNISSIAIAKRSLVQATEAAVQRGVHTLDLSTYYKGKGTFFSAFIPHAKEPVPIDCNKSLSEIQDELTYWQNDHGSMKRRELQGIDLVDFNCDGYTVSISTVSRANVPLVLPFTHLRNFELHASAGATNVRSSGFYLFGIRIF